MLNRGTALAHITVIILAGTHLNAADWPHWRGPHLNGSSDEVSLPDTWGESNNVAWVTDLPGPSSATPVIAGGRVFTSSMDRESNALLALCLDSHGGKELWRQKLGESDRRVPRNDLATPSPVTDGRRVYFMYGSGDLAGLDTEGNILWSRNLEDDYGNISLKYGYSSSPLLYDNKLYIIVLRRSTAYRAPRDTNLDSFILAIDSSTGKTIWKQPRESDAQDETQDSYSSPILYQGVEGPELIVIGASIVTSNDPVTGKEIWRYEYPEQRAGMDRNISSPLPGDGLVYAVPPRGSLGLLAIKIGGRGTLGSDQIAWTFDGPSPDCSTPLYYKGHVYILADRTRGTVTCVDAVTGEQRWQGVLGGGNAWWASITAGDDKLYCISENAEVVVLAAGAERFNVLSRIDMEDGPVQGSIAIADGCLFIRTASKLYCVGTPNRSQD